MDVQIGEIYEGKVTGITNFGAFVMLSVGKSGMVHISEIANTYVDDINKHLTEGQSVKVRVVAVDANGRINLSIKKAEAPVQETRQQQKPVLQKSDNDVFEDKLKQFIQSSESKMSDLRSGRERRGARRRK